MPCKPRMQGCRASCLHRLLVESYRQRRAVWETDLEEASIGYATEAGLWAEENPGPTFKQWLIDNKNSDRKD